MAAAWLGALACGAEGREADERLEHRESTTLTSAPAGPEPVELLLSGTVGRELLCPNVVVTCFRTDRQVTANANGYARVRGSLVDGRLVIHDEEPTSRRHYFGCPELLGGEPRATGELLATIEEAVGPRIETSWVGLGLLHLAVEGDPADVLQVVSDLGAESSVCVMGGSKNGLLPGARWPGSGVS